MTRKQQLLVGTAVVLAMALLAGLTGFVLLVRPVVGESMEPTLNNGDRVLVPLWKGDIGRFDVVALHPPGSGDLAVKRVIGLPGDQVMIDADAAGPVLLVRPAGAAGWSRVVAPSDARPWTRPDRCCSPTGASAAAATAVSVPDGDYFVLGDNRDLSVDSRGYGFVPADRVRSRISTTVSPMGSVRGGYRLEPVGG